MFFQKLVIADAQTKPKFALIISTLMTSIAIAIAEKSCSVILGSSSIKGLANVSVLTVRTMRKNARLSEDFGCKRNANVSPVTLRGKRTANLKVSILMMFNADVTTALIDMKN